MTTKPTSLIKNIISYKLDDEKEFFYHTSATFGKFTIHYVLLHDEKVNDAVDMVTQIGGLAEYTKNKLNYKKEDALITNLSRLSDRADLIIRHEENFGKEDYAFHSLCETAYRVFNDVNTLNEVYRQLLRTMERKVMYKLIEKDGGNMTLSTRSKAKKIVEEYVDCDYSKMQCEEPKDITAILKKLDAA